MNCQVVNVKKAHLVKSGYKDFQDWVSKEDNVYIGRDMSFYVPGAKGSKWKNPFPAKKMGRDACVAKFEEYIRADKELISQLHELKGKTLGCWCAPENCHGFVLARLVGEFCGDESESVAGRSHTETTACLKQFTEKGRRSTKRQRLESSASATSTEKVVNVKKNHLHRAGYKNLEDWLAVPNHVYIGRDMSQHVPGALGSKWQNIFKDKKNTTKEERLTDYENYIRGNPELLSQLGELKGKVLGCWCAPEGCHGHVLVKLIEEFYPCGGPADPRPSPPRSTGRGASHSFAATMSKRCPLQQGGQNTFKLKEEEFPSL